MTRAALLGLVLALPLAAQAKLTAKSFLPPDYTNVFSVDLAAMRAAGIWEDVERSTLAPVIKQLVLESGWPLSRVDRTTAVLVIDIDAAASALIDGAFKMVHVLEGNAPLPFAPALLSNCTPETIASHEFHAAKSGDWVFTNPLPEIQVYGSRSLIVPVLEGTPSNGQPAADVMSLLSGRGSNLACLVFDLRSVPFRRRFLLDVIGDAGWPADDFPRVGVSVRVRVIGEKDDPHLQIEGVLRHRTAGRGLDVSQQAAKAWLAAMAADPRLAAIKSVWDRAELKTQVGDLIATVDLGRSHDAVAAAALIAAPIFTPVLARQGKVAAPQPVDGIPKKQ